MRNRWKKGLLVSIAVAARWTATQMAKLAESARTKADAILPAVALAVMIGGLVLGSYAVSHAVVVAAR